MYICVNKRGDLGEIWFDVSHFLAVEDEVDPIYGEFLYSTLYLNFCGTVQIFSIVEKAEDVIKVILS